MERLRRAQEWWQADERVNRNSTCRGSVVAAVVNRVTKCGGVAESFRLSVESISFNRRDALSIIRAAH